MNMKFAAHRRARRAFARRHRPRRRPPPTTASISVPASPSQYRTRLSATSAATRSTTTASRSSRGFRPLDWLAVEANYIDLGGDSRRRHRTLDSTRRHHGVGAGARGNRHRRPVRARSAWPSGTLDSSRSGVGSVSDDGWEPTYGVGIGVHFGSLGVRAEYETFSQSSRRLSTTDVNTISLSVTYTFL